MIYQYRINRNADIRRSTQPGARRVGRLYRNPNADIGALSVTMSEHSLPTLKVSRRSFVAGVGASVLGSATASAAGGLTGEHVIRIESVSGPVSYVLSVDGEIRAPGSLCEASDRRVGGTALGRLARHDVDEYRATGPITRLWSTGDVRVSVDGEAWTGTTDAGTPSANTHAPVETP